MRLKAAERRDEIMRAAIAVFGASNYRRAGVAQIARRAGVSEPLIYRHFPNKQALFVEILACIGSRILEIWGEAVVGTGDALAALRRAGELYVENLRSHPAEAALQFQALAEAGEPEIAEVLRTNHRGYVRFFEDLVERGQREGVIRAEIDPRAAAWLLNSVGFSLTAVDLLGLGADLDDTRVAVMIGGLLDWLAVSPTREDDR